MVEKVVLNLVDQMKTENLINEDDREYYEYALITMIERTIAVTTLLLIGACRGKLIPAILFMVFFFSLRKRTGGYHADKFWKCYLLTTITFSVIMQIGTMLSGHMVIVYILLAVAVITILIIGTVNHPNMDMDDRELRDSKKSARRIVLCESVLIIIMSGLNMDREYVVYASIAIILCASLICLAKVIKQEV